MNLLTNRAAQIEDGGDQVGTRVDLDRLYIISHMSFNCTGSITSLLLGVQIRTVTSTGEPTENPYPAISLWNPGVNDQLGPVYTKVHGSERSIVLGPSNFSTSGVIEYLLDPPIQFQDGNVLGWLQEEEVVRMYQIEKAGFTTLTFPKSTSTVLDIVQESTIIVGETLVIHPVTGESMVLIQTVYKPFLYANRCWILLSHWPVPF